MHILLCYRRAFPALSRPARGQIKKREQSTQKILFVRNTFTGTFCCLADNGTVTPNSKELYTLSWHGLGKKRHTFESKDGDHKYLQTELEKLFPRLKAANGKFQLTGHWGEEVAGEVFIRSLWVLKDIPSTGYVKTLQLAQPAFMWCLWWHFHRNQTNLR